MPQLTSYATAAASQSHAERLNQAPRPRTPGTVVQWHSGQASGQDEGSTVDGHQGYGSRQPGLINTPIDQHRSTSVIDNSIDQHRPRSTPVIDNSMISNSVITNLGLLINTDHDQHP